MRQASVLGVGLVPFGKVRIVRARVVGSLRWKHSAQRGHLVAQDYCLYRVLSDVAYRGGFPKAPKVFVSCDHLVDAHASADDFYFMAIIRITQVWSSFSVVRSLL